MHRWVVQAVVARKWWGRRCDDGGAAVLDTWESTQTLTRHFPCSRVRLSERPACECESVWYKSISVESDWITPSW